MAPFVLLKSSSAVRDADCGPSDTTAQKAKCEPTQISRQSRRKHFLRLFRTTPQKPRMRLSSEFASPITPTFPPDSVSETDTEPNEKPLPPPPLDSVQCESDPDPAPARKLQRIMSTIEVADIQKLFSGAPQFFCRSEGHYSGAPHPSVAFPWDSELSIRDLCDHHQITVEAWTTVTTWPHITKRGEQEVESSNGYQDKRRRASFRPHCRERPNMLSTQGLERGTVGFQAALELGVADAIQQPEQVAVDDDPRAALELRKVFLTRKEGLRPVAESTLIDRLISVGRLYLEPLDKQRPTIDLYTELFTQVLYPPSKVTDSEDPFSLQVQIEALVEVLATPRVWVDLSLVEWRTRIGQILWDAEIDEGGANDAIPNNEVTQEASAQKYWLLLQILLGCELLIRLSAITQDLHNGPESPNSRDVAKFEKVATENVKWTLLLASSWLENILVDRMSPIVVQDKPVAAGWFTSLTGFAPSPQAVKHEEGIHSIRIQGRNQNHQLSGLLHFARELKWPDREIIATKVGLNTISISDSARSTPAATPSSCATQKSGSYFGHVGARSEVKRGFYHDSNRMSTTLQPSGWLSNSYISGLILPGETLSHFMISTLLENDDHALLKLGEEANFYGGFVYRERSFWSTACIVGRVLAASKRACSCLGWISCEIRPLGFGDGWLDIEATAVGIKTHNDKPRIYQKASIEKDSHVIGGADINLVLPGDFALPLDCAVHATPTISLVALELQDSNGKVVSRSPRNISPASLPPPDAAGRRTFTAVMRFLVSSHDQTQKEMSIGLNHNVHFVTAHPCIPSSHVGILKSPSTGSLASLQGDRSPSPSRATGHPVHKAYTYTLLPLSLILNSAPSTPISDLLSPLTPSLATDDLIRSHSSTHTTSSTILKVLVIDCTTNASTTSPAEAHHPLRPSASSLGTASQMNRRDRGARHGSDAEMLIRAICAERGWDAIISRKERGCLACAVREAGALRWGVVLRI